MRESEKKTRKLSGATVVSFFISLALCSFVISITIINRSNVEKLQMEHIILEKSVRINEVISRLLYKTQVLSALVVQGNGSLENFEKVAPSIVDDDSILNVLVAPDGVVKEVYPLEGNEAVIGLDFFSEGAGNIEAIAARDTGQLVLGGPFNLRQGGQGLVGRAPVYVDTPDEARKFWGLVSVTLKFPQALNAVDLDILRTQNIAYELWRISPDTNERQVIDGNLEHARRNARFIESPVELYNAEWYLRLSSTRMWYSYPENIALILAGLFICFLVSFVVQNNVELRHMRSVLEIAKGNAEAAAEAIIAGMTYASRIQRNMLPTDSMFGKSFSDYSIIWRPRDIVGGDIYWMKHFDEGTVLCVCDCTGHGTPGALLTMLVVSAFEAQVRPNNCNDTANIIWRLEERLVRVFSVSGDVHGRDIRDGCDLAVLFIAKNGSVTISSGKTHVFVCDGKEVHQIKGQRIYVGEGRLKSKKDIETVWIPANPAYKFYIASDGLFEQLGGELSEPYGYKAFKKIILENHAEKQSVISDKVWKSFEEYRGAEPQLDDFELISFKA